jgi:DNA-binding MarR family transcriptional regulator
MADQAERSLLLDVYAAYHKSGQIVERAVEGTGITAEDFAFVSIVGIREPVTPTEIAREFGHSLSTVLFRAGRNVDLGFVERISNPQDGRSFLLRLTSDGREAWFRAATNLKCAVEALEARLSRPAGEIQQVLRELQTAFDEEGAGARAAGC